MTIKDVIERIHNAESTPISISEDDWKRFDSSASVTRLRGTPEEVKSAVISFIENENLSIAHNMAIVLFCNPDDSIRVMDAVPAEEIYEAGLRPIYSICCSPITADTVELYII